MSAPNADLPDGWEWEPDGDGAIRKGGGWVYVNVDGGVTFVNVESVPMDVLCAVLARRGIVIVDPISGWTLDHDGGVTQVRHTDGTTVTVYDVDVEVDGSASDAVVDAAIVAHRKHFRPGAGVTS